MKDMDVVVVGAGVVGLAVATAWARKGHSVLVLESESGPAQGVTSRSSEVVHAGLYYPTESLKARLCVEGRERLYAFCESRQVAFRKTGKWIVATEDDQIERLEAIESQGRANGVSGLFQVDSDQVRQSEPDVECRAALLSSETGIVDSHGLSLSLLAELEGFKGRILTRHEVVGLERIRDCWRVDARHQEEVQSVVCGILINAAGLDSDQMAALAGIPVETSGYRIHPCKGDYFSLAPSAPIELSRLVYPVPAGAGLGIHATLDLAGAIRFGPDAEYVDARDFRVESEKAGLFAEVIQRYLPRVRAEWLSPDYSGIRPRLARPGEAFRDFVVAEESAVGLPGLINCVGIESPGLTAALAIGEYTLGLV